MARYAQRLRQAQGLRPRARRPGQRLPHIVEVQPQPLTTRRATRLVLKRPQQRTDADTQLIAPLQAPHSALAVAIDLAQDFCTLMRERQADRFDHWLARAVASGVAPLRRFATGLHADYDAVKAGISLPWSTGPVRGPHRPLEDAEAVDVWARQDGPLEPAPPACGVTPAAAPLPRATGGHHPRWCIRYALWPQAGRLTRGWGHMRRRHRGWSWMVKHSIDERQSRTALRRGG